MAMNKIRSYIFIGLSMLSLSSCNEWLDVKPETEVREDDLFSSYKGYKEALAGCYSAMTSRDLYGEKLTISDVECLANLWNQPSKSYKDRKSTRLNSTTSTYTTMRTSMQETT